MFPIKVMGANVDGFAQAMVDIGAQLRPGATTPPRVRGAAEPRRQVPRPDADRHRDQARAARRAVPQPEQSCAGQGRALTWTSQRRHGAAPTTMRIDARPSRLRGLSGACATSRRRARPTIDDELWLVEHEPVYTQGVGGAANMCSTPAASPVVHTQPRRPGHLPRPRTGGGLPAGGPAASANLCEGVRVPPRTRCARGARGLRRHWPSRGRRPRHLCAARRPLRPCGVDGPGARWRPVSRPGQDCRAGHQGKWSLRLPRRGAERGMDSEPLRRYQPLRFRRAACDRPGYTGSPPDWATWHGTWASV